MSDPELRVRLCRATNEIEIQGPAHLVSEWWDRLLPEIEHASVPPGNGTRMTQPTALAPRTPPAQTQDQPLPGVFGEFIQRFPKDIPDIQKVLVAAWYSQQKDADNCFTTRSANDLLIEQGIKIANPSQCVKRLNRAKRSFVVAPGRYRVSATGKEHIESLLMEPGGNRL